MEDTNDKTEQLYGQISNAHAPYTNQEEQLLQQAQLKTQVNSHYSHLDPKTILSNCYIYQGVSLVQSEASQALVDKHKPYTIIKATQYTKSPIGQEELRHRLANSRHHISKQKTFQPKFSRSKSIQYEFKKLKGRPSFRKQINQSTFINQPKRARDSHQQYQNHQPDSRHKPETKETTVVQPVKIEQKIYKFRSMKDRVTGNRKNNPNNGSYNLFSCIDEPINKKIQSSNQQWLCRPNLIVTTKLGALQWQK